MHSIIQHVKYLLQQAPRQAKHVFSAVTYPRSGGMAPTTAPTHVLTGCICFNGVYTNAYRMRLDAASPAAKPLACTDLAKIS